VILAVIGLFAANFVFIGLKAIQQRNVQYLKYVHTFLTSHLLALVEVFVIFTVAERGVALETVLPIGIGGGLGAVCAMYLTRGYNHK
jgi:hypothetical protein|tara:strand:- start:7777 stop:8037 length:261 start_codon:yes stop_codon:yes gene_type:complete